MLRLPAARWCLTRGLVGLFVSVAIGAGVTFATPENRAQASVALQPVEVWRDLFADRSTTFHFTLTSDTAMRGNVVWSLSAGGRTVSRGSIATELASGKPVQADVPVQAPHVDEGVALQTQLTVSFVDDNSEGEKPGAAASYEQTIWVFPEEAFANRTRWLKELKITLYDPIGKTATQLQQAGVPFSQTRSLASLEGVDEGLIVIGEGISLRENFVLGEEILARAVAGMTVLFLAPSEGQLPLTATKDNRAFSKKDRRPSGVTLRDANVVRQLDKRLDADRWLGGRAVQTRFQLVPGEQGDSVQIAPRDQGWPWVDVEFTNPKGQLVLCGFAIMERWEDGPVPRYLFSRILEHVSGQALASTTDSES